MANIKEAWAADPDMENRDPNALNDHLQITWEEAIGEPEHTRSIDCLWKYSFKCFNLWKTLCYIILSTICGIPHAVCWGCTFACVAFVHIWELTPYIRCVEVCIAPYKKLYTIILDATCKPCCEAVGGVFVAFKK